MFSTSFGKWRQATFFDDNAIKEKEKRVKESNSKDAVSKVDSKKENKSKHRKQSKSE